ncbi:MAG: bifunctional 4-hydroxy-2-oxoglutarate aldolase/2-dehydro-3-deoxy-phosphogluconate aldolase [Candidatus Pelethousia sp.]|nr:bifunctional 4-hydroxy-2-oxoglutarate aldolase/2-dehydro-3-deoxy-phosphogluconate aldolase [Candidatus Pelethousia sp.]
MNTLAFILRNKVITICRKVYGVDLLHLAGALLAGGVKLIEVTFDQADPDCIPKTVQAIRSLNETYAGQMLFGAGTVLTGEQVEAAKEAGARYIISPNVDPAVIRRTKELGLVSIPGAMTPSEIITAHNQGADIVKLFPAGYLGFGYIKDILGPISHVKLCATGGVTEENLAQYLDLGFAGAGISGRLCDKGCIAAGDFEQIAARAQAFTNIAQTH